MRNLTDMPWRHRVAGSIMGPMNDGETILDIGCGEFAILERYLIPRSCMVVTLDLNVQALAKSRQLLKIEGRGNVNIVRATATDLPLKDQCVDRILMLDVIEHLPTNMDDKALREAARIAKPGGMLIVSTPNYCLTSNLLDPHWLLGHRHYRLEVLTSKMAKALFDIEQRSVRGGIVTALEYIAYLPWHLFWSHVLLRIREPALPFQRFFNKLVAREVFTERSRSGMTIFMKARRHGKQ